MTVNPIIPLPALYPAVKPDDIEPKTPFYEQMMNRIDQEAMDKIIAKQDAELTEILKAAAAPQRIMYGGGGGGSHFRDMWTIARSAGKYKPPPPAEPAFLDYTDSYMRKVHKPEVLRDLAEKYLTNVDYDTLVGTGLSGTIAVTDLARWLGKNYLVVRKPNDGSHSRHPVEGKLGKRWIFVDDLVQTGQTLARVYDVIETLRKNRGFSSEFVGSFLYADGCFYKPTQAGHHKWLRFAENYDGQYEPDSPAG